MENENVKIEYVENGVSKDGYQKFIYNFILDGKNVNHLFKGFGRITKKSPIFAFESDYSWARPWSSRCAPI